MKLIIAGSRTYESYLGLCRILRDTGLHDRITMVISGGARGADSLGERWANDHKRDLRVIYGDWKTHGRKAGPLRNEYMAANADALLAIRNTKSSRGTDDMIRRARAHGLEVHVFEYTQLPPLERAGSL